MIQKIVAIGGGRIFPSEVTAISREIIRLSGKKHPRLIFLPTALLDDKAYIRATQYHYGQQLGCKVEPLYLIKGKPKLAFIRDKILSSDIVCVSGGNTLRMMNRWKKLGVDRVLREAWAQGKVLCGQSAGAICWFRQGNSDSRKFRHPQAKLIKVRGLGFIDALACPHYDVEKDRKPALKEMMKKTSGVAIAMDNCAALEIVGNRYRAIASKSTAQVYRVFWQKGHFCQKAIAKSRWQLLDQMSLKNFEQTSL